MSSQYIGINEARPRLGDLVTIAQGGTDVIITRNGRPVVRMTRYQEEAVETATPIPPLSEGTLAAIASLVDNHVMKEYGQDAQIEAATMLSMAGLDFDLREHYLALSATRDDSYLNQYLGTRLRILVREGMEARACQCRQLHQTCPHRRERGSGMPFCDGHYEHDVPAIDGALLCGPCHVGEYEARGGEV